MTAVSFGQCLTHRIMSSAGDTVIQVSLGSVFYPKRYELMSIGTGSFIGGVATNYFLDSFSDSTETCRVHLNYSDSKETYGVYEDTARVVFVAVASLFISCAIFSAFSMNNPAVNMDTFSAKKVVVMWLSVLPHWLTPLQWMASVCTLVLARHLLGPNEGANRA